MKRLFSIAITLTAALGLAACGGTSGTDTTTPDAAPAAPTGLVLTGAEQTSLSFSWNASAGADSYKWRLVKGVTSAAEGSVTQTSVSIPGLEAGTEYTFSVRAVSAAGMSVWSNLGASTQKAPAPEPQPGGKVQCTDAPIVVGYSGTPVLGKSGLIRVLDAKGSEVDRIDLSDIATVDLLPDGTMIPKGADADNGKIAIGNDYVFNSFMDALHSSNYRAVHYTPLRINGNTLEIKLHNEALDFGAAYTVKIDDAVAGMPAEDISFTTKAAPADEATIRVAADGSADFCTVQGALSYVSAKIKKDAPVTIEIANGTYRELLFLRNKNNVTLKGASRERTVIAYPNNDSYETGSGASLSSKPRTGASIGKSGGRCLFLVESCDNLVIEGLTIENTYSIPSHKGQAETIYFNADGKRLTIGDCNLLSWQDTFLCKGKVWVHDSLIAGHVDFIWGYPEACLFENCEIRSRAGGYIVQARINNAADKGFVFLGCTLTAESGVKDGSVYLARSGGDSSKWDNVTYVNCKMSSAIAPAGWFSSPAPNPASPSAVSGWKEFGTTGASTAQRSTQGRLLTAEEAASYSSKQAVLGW